MKRFFTILVVLMVAGILISCNMPNAGTSDNESDTTKATVKLAQKADENGPICVIEFNGKYFWCTVKAFDIIGGKECTIKADYYGQPDYEGIEYIECDAANGHDVDSSIICVKGEVNYHRSCIIFNNSNKDRGDFYYYKDSSIYYKQ